MIDIQIGDCRDILKNIPDNSIHCCVTSPPYYQLRDYGVSRQIGLENSIEEYVDALVEVFREVKRVLRPDGTLWINLGDSYAGSGRPRPPGVKNKDLMGVPWRVAFALQEDGWWLRQDIIWSKPNPLPESVTDRCTKAHDYVFLLSKSSRYYFDQEAICEPCSPNSHLRWSQKTIAKQKGSTRAHGGQRHNGPLRAVGRKYDPGRNNRNNPGFDAALLELPKNRNKRSVWTIPTQGYSGAHFATFPLALVEPCVLAGCPVGGTVLDPFAGSGTVGEFCRTHDRNAILIELNPEYETLIRERCRLDLPELGQFVEVYG
jgi:DNA modification methylase